MQKFEQSCTIICRKVTNLNHCNIEKNIANMKYHEYYDIRYLTRNCIENWYETIRLPQFRFLSAF